MTTFDAILVGFLVAVLCGVIGFFTWKSARLLHDLTTALQRVATPSQQLVGLVSAIAQELAFMRSLTGATTPIIPNSGIDQPPPSPGEGPTGPAAPPPFPPTFIDRFPKVVAPEPEKDAEVEDTDRELLEQTDAELAAAQVLEDLRQRGMDVEDSDVVHPGIVADAE